MGSLPEGASSDNVVSFVQEAVDALKISDYAKAADLTTLIERLVPVETKLAGIEDGAQSNKVETVSTEFDLVDQHLSIKEISQEKIIGLPDALLEKVDKVKGARLITEDEATKLEKLVLGDNGEVSVSGKVAAGNVDGLDAWITARAATLAGLSENNLSNTLLEKLNGIETGAQSNTIEVIQVNGTALVVSDKAVNIAATDIVKGSTEVTVSEDGTLGIGEVDVDKLVQKEGTHLILNGGSAVD